MSGVVDRTRSNNVRLELPINLAAEDRGLTA